MYFDTYDTAFITTIEGLHEIQFEELRYVVLIFQKLVPKLIIQATCQNDLK